MTVLDCSRLAVANVLMPPGILQRFDPFTDNFCLTDIVTGLYSFPEGVDGSKASCSIFLVRPQVSSYLFKFFIDKNGHQIHLNSGVFCPSGSYISASSGVFSTGGTSSFRLLMTGFYC
jgi:hypothetical protein